MIKIILAALLSAAVAFGPGVAAARGVGTVLQGVDPSQAQAIQRGALVLWRVPSTPEHVSRRERVR